MFAATVRHGQQPGLLERDAVVLVDPRAWRAGLPKTASVAASRPVEVGDQAQQRRLAAAGRPDQRDELARGDLEVDAGERVDLAALACGKTLPTPAAAHREVRSAAVRGPGCHRSGHAVASPRR